MAKRFQRVNVEIGNVCNLQCGFCPAVEREQKLMDRALFEKLIRELAPLTEEVCLHLMGEPLAHPGLADCVAVCAREGVKVNLTTNGTLLDEAKRELLLSPIIGQVNFSLHSYESNFPGGDLGAYLERIFLFTEAALERRPDLYVNFRLWNLQGAEGGRNPEILERVSRRLAVEARPAPAGRKSRRLKARLYLHFDSAFEWPSLQSPLLSDRGTCQGLSNHFGIHADGTVVPCCLDKEAGAPLGKASEAALEAILAAPRARAMAEGFREGRLVEDLCKRCSYIRRFDGKLKKLEPAGV